MYGGCSVSWARTRRHTSTPSICGIIQSRIASRGRVVGLQRLPGLGAVLGHHDLVAPAFEHPLQQQPRGHIVLGDEDSHRAPPFAPQSVSQPLELHVKLLGELRGLLQRAARAGRLRTVRDRPQGLGADVGRGSLEGVRLTPGARRVAGGQLLMERRDLPRSIVEKLRGDLGGGFAIAGEQIEQDGLIEHRRPASLDGGGLRAISAAGAAARQAHGRLGRRRPPGPAHQRGRQFIRLDRLGQVVVHARGQAGVAVLLHGVGGEGHDGDVVIAHGGTAGRG